MTLSLAFKQLAHKFVRILEFTNLNSDKTADYRFVEPILFCK